MKEMKSLMSQLTSMREKKDTLPAKNEILQRIVGDLENLLDLNMSPEEKADYALCCKTLKKYEMQNKYNLDWLEGAIDELEQQKRKLYSTKNVGENK